MPIGTSKYEEHQTPGRFTAYTAGTSDPAPTAQEQEGQSFQFVFNRYSYHHREVVGQVEADRRRMGTSRRH